MAKKAKPLLEVHASSESTKSDVFSYLYSFIDVSLKRSGCVTYFEHFRETRNHLLAHRLINVLLDGLGMRNFKLFARWMVSVLEQFTKLNCVNSGEGLIACRNPFCE
jgi:hypothetical protein